ncbi:L-cysteine desulfidase [Thermanaeromonas toyohensis ToBE]|uniref:L-cysteine desulfidase n=1 Tax=Thermanaeromonas toyohensis ToBE TaxID=698762 RepID=A0A1W1W217_9FIRM|nr:L-cysteine desulfidase [Thermanaeromonas toyohensis ToBE]
MLRELQREIRLAVGCTEPAAIALAAAHATAALGDLPQEVEVILDPQTYRNALAVGLPYTSLKGPAMSAALGVFLPPQKELLIFADLDPHKARKAEELCCNGRVHTIYDPSFPDLYIEVRVKNDIHRARACIKYTHTNLVLIEGPRFNQNKFIFTSNQSLKFNLWENISFQDIFPLLDQLAPEDLGFLYQAARTNLAMAKCGLQKGSGMALGRKLLHMSRQALATCRYPDFNWLGVCLTAQALACAAVDARMSGEPLPVATLGGSGNQGITSLLPVWLLAKKLRVKQETMVKSLALSATVTLLVKNKLGSLSRICSSAFAGSWGIAAATLWLLGSDFPCIARTLCNLASSLSGIICDGAKPSCSLKVMVGVEIGLKTALLTLQGLAVSPSGLVAETVDRTLDNVASLARVGMAGVDQILLASATH